MKMKVTAEADEDEGNSGMCRGETTQQPNVMRNKTTAECVEEK